MRTSSTVIPPHGNKLGILLYQLYLGILLVFYLISNTTQAGTSPESESPPGASAFSSLGFSKQYFWFSIGNFTENRESQFQNPRDQASWAFSASGLFSESDSYQIGLDLELRYLSRKVDTTIPPPLLGTIYNDTDIDTYVVALGLRGITPAHASLQAYISGGLAYYQSHMFVYGQQLGFPGKIDDQDSQINFYFGAGFMWQPSSLSLAIDVRQFMHSASFGTFNINDADLGGRSVVLSIGSSWP